MNEYEVLGQPEGAAPYSVTVRAVRVEVTDKTGCLVFVGAGEPVVDAFGPGVWLRCRLVRRNVEP